MKKILYVVLAFFIFVYALPIITLGMKDISPSDTGNKQDAKEETERLTAIDIWNQTLQNLSTEDVASAQQKSYDEKTYISVLIDGKVCDMTVGEYLVGVVAAEMPASFPIEALKAQAVAARSYMLHKIENGYTDQKHNGAQLCDDYTHCTAFFDIKSGGKDLWGEEAEYYAQRIQAAVSDTDGVVAVSEGQVIAAVFHSASSDMTEDAENVWGVKYPYLVSVSSVGGSSSPNYYGTEVITQNDFFKTIQTAYPKAFFGSDVSKWITNIRRTQSGGVLDLYVGGVLIKGTEIRSMFDLNSTNFNIEISNNEIVFTTVGTGHGVGMSQFGAREMALNGAYFDEIICHYYNGVQLMVKN